MAAPRATQFIALRNLTRAPKQVRHLHMTGPATYSSPFLNREPNNDLPSTRRPTSQEQTYETNKPTTRHFNTSRELKQVNDTSTIDFAYLPDVISPDNVDIYSQVRVPILPNLNINTSNAVEPEEPVFRPTISSSSADAVYLPMSEMTDGHGMGIDFHAMADRVAANLRSISAPVEEQASMMKQVWTDIIDDVTGKGRVAKA